MAKRALLTLILAAFSVPAAPAADPDLTTAKPPDVVFTELKTGRYALKVQGLLCTACTRAAVEELSKLASIQKVEADFDDAEIVVFIKKDRKVSMSSVRRALRKAARRVNLGTHFEVASVVYRPTL